jgi:hypothetical protein
MPYTGQNIYKSALVDSRERSVSKIQDVRSGNWNRVLPEQTSAGKYMSTKSATRDYLRSGNAFRGNIRDKQAEYNQRSVSGFLQRKQAIDQG